MGSYTLAIYCPKLMSKSCHTIAMTYKHFHVYTEGSKNSLYSFGLYCIDIDRRKMECLSRSRQRDPACHVSRDTGQKINRTFVKSVFAWHATTVISKQHIYHIPNQQNLGTGSQVPQPSCFWKFSSQATLSGYSQGTLSVRGPCIGTVRGPCLGTGYLTAQRSRKNI